MKLQQTGRAVALLALVATAAHADFKSALAEYHDGHYEAAHTQFLALAELGDPASQFNLGAMALQGQGGPKDLASAVGWFTAAADNGNHNLAPDKLAAMKSRLTDAERSSAEQLAGRYDRDGLGKTVLPVPPYTAYCRDLVPAHVLKAGEGSYPRSGRFSDKNGFVILQLTIGVDGTGRDPEVLMAVPDADFSAAAVDLWLQARFAPATQDGYPVESKVAVKSAYFMIGGGVLWDTAALKTVRESALTGEPSAQYVIGLAATLDHSLGIPASQAHQLLVSAAQGGHPRAQYWVASRFMSIGSCDAQKKKLPWLRAAATAGDGPAQLALALELLNGQPTAAQLSEVKLLLEQAAQSDDFYVMKHVAALLASSAVDAIRDPRAALLVAKRLEKNPIEADPQMFEALAVAYAANRDFWEAAAKEKTAIKKASVLRWNTQLMEQRYATYHHSQPWAGDVFSLPAVAAAAR